jgi:hypothetical protein
MRNSVLIATPAYGGLLHSNYVKSVVTTCNELAMRGIPHGLYIIPDESLISRGRNRCAAFALQRGFEKLLFIDADLGWKLEDIQAVLDSDKLLVGGTYPIKQLTPPRLAFNPLEETTIPENIDLRSIDELHYLKTHHADAITGEVEVRHIPTGFMLIDCAVLKRLQEFLPHYQQENTETGQIERHYDYFPVRLVGEMYETEDWAFCSLVREHLNCGVWLNTNVVLNHTGTYTYTAGELSLGKQNVSPMTASGSH